MTTVDPTLLLDVFVRGIPAPQGSKRPVGHGRMIESSRRVKPWRDAVRSTVAEAWPYDMLDAPFVVELKFLFQRPAGHYGTGRNQGQLKPSAPYCPAGYPDLDKLIRSTMDGITAAGVWRDDARVVLIAASKQYCLRLEHPGAYIFIRHPVFADDGPPPEEPT